MSTCNLDPSLELMDMDETLACPHCGAELPSDAKFCRHCGSSESDGWRDDADGNDFDDFDYDEYVAENFPDHPMRTSTKPIWRVVAIVLLGLFLLGYLFL